MKLRFTEKADKDYARLPVVIRKAFGYLLRFLPGTPKIHSGTLDLLPGRVTQDWRSNLKIEGDESVILSIIPHPKY